MKYWIFFFDKEGELGRWLTEQSEDVRTRVRIPGTHIKLDVVAYLYDPSAPVPRWESSGAWRLVCPSGTAVNYKEMLSQTL